MKHSKIVLSVVMVFAVAAAAFTAAHKESEKERNGLLRHVVSFKFKDDATKAQIDDVVKAFGDLQNDMPFILDFEWGTNVSPEPLAAGYTHCFILTFKTAKDRDAYLPHPAHKAFGEQLGPVLDKVFVIDFWTK